ncbi:ornithine decarboxylase 1-like, partial [Condylostylus longicornis]|uniref:ornithine decarboxylase 1-like n=1 Tax=Condylostylus longicornis TaxID=2530218 RepID=UPI00244E4D2F
HYYTNKINFDEIISSPEFIKSEEPLYIVDLADIVNKFFVWKEVMPRVQPFYAVKCNDHPVILKLLSELGTGFDCASKGEINRVMNLDVQSNRIIFANPTKPIAHLLHAKQYGVYTMTYDGEYELHKIKKYFPNASLVLRIRCEAEKAQCPLGEKFGCDPIIDAPKLLKIAYDLNLNVVGISFHVGSGCQDFPVYERAIAHSKRLFEYGETLGFKMNLLDIGGGFPGKKNSKILEVGGIISRALNKYFPPEDNITIIAEPGRFFVASSHTLICKVHSKREVVRENKLEKVMYFINDGVYGSFNCILYDHQAATPQYLKENINEKDENGNIMKYKSSIWGPTCDALDQICEEVYFPKLEIGEVIIFENMGAYTVPIASAFNGFPLPKIQFFMNKKYK